MNSVTLLVSRISLSPDESEALAFDIALKRLKKFRLAPSSDKGINTFVARRSVDARKKNDLKLVYTVAVAGIDPSSFDRQHLPDGIALKTDEVPRPSKGNAPLSHRPIVVGCGPAGLFSALLLAEEGYHPILLERGGDIDDRVRMVERFYRTRLLDENCNIQFGAGGAGTFSDGKLVTRTNDPWNDYVLARFVEFGAPKEILYQAKPHIGTDILRNVVRNMLERIRFLGGDIQFRTPLEDIKISNAKLVGIRAGGIDIPCNTLILAIGHSARDTYEMLLQKPLSIEGKPFSVGMRIEHLQSDIDNALYGKYAGHAALGHAEYALSANTDSRGVYTFCMCPGGEVMAAASESGGLVVNGMSNHARDGKNANAAVAVSVFPDDYGRTPCAAIAYQRKIERAAFVAGGGDYTVPLCTLGDFFEGSYKHLPSRILPTYMGGNAFKIADPALFLPSKIISSLRDGLHAFGRRISGFDVCDALLSGAETRTSAPIRILRTPERIALGCDGLYPCGEGAGYAGGITSAALDGLRTAVALMAKYSPNS